MEHATNVTSNTRYLQSSHFFPRYPLSASLSTFVVKNVTKLLMSIGERLCLLQDNVGVVSEDVLRVGFHFLPETVGGCFSHKRLPTPKLRKDVGLVPQASRQQSGQIRRLVDASDGRSTAFLLANSAAENGRHCPASRRSVRQQGHRRPAVRNAFHLHNIHRLSNYNDYRRNCLRLFHSEGFHITI